MRPLRLVAAVVAAAALASSCGDAASEAAVESPVDAAVGAEDEGVAGFGDRRPVSSGEPLPALEPSDDAPFTVDQIPSTALEDVASALRDPNDASFPPPLVDPDRIRSGGPPPDGIPPIDDPRFERAAAVDWLVDVEPVLVVEVDGDARAYPIQIMTWHELVNDTIGGHPVTVSFCPLCNSALAYDRRVGDRILDFGTSGRLFNSSLVMYDRQTESLWTHFDASAVVGELTGERLTTLPVTTTSWISFRDAHPDGLVLSRDTGHRRDYGRNPYVGYDDVETSPFLFDGVVDGRLAAKTRVVVVRDFEGDEPPYAIVAEELFTEQVIEFSAHGRDLVAVNAPGLASALDRGSIAEGYDTGATAVFAAQLDGAPIRLQPAPAGFLDTVSGITFDLLGHPTDEGIDRGLKLEPIEHLDTFWFAIGAFEPDTVVHGL